MKGLVDDSTTSMFHVWMYKFQEYFSGPVQQKPVTMHCYLQFGSLFRQRTQLFGRY